MTIVTSCKFCKGPITATAHPDCPELHLEAWKPLLCCNRCGEFQEWFRRIINRARAAAGEWAVLLPTKREAGRQDTAEKLAQITRRIADVVCRFYRIGYYWDQDFIDQIMEQPDKTERIIRAYENGCRREGLRQRDEALAATQP